MFCQSRQERNQRKSNNHHRDFSQLFEISQSKNLLQIQTVSFQKEKIQVQVFGKKIAQVQNEEQTLKVKVTQEEKVEVSFAGPQEEISNSRQKQTLQIKKEVTLAFEEEIPVGFEMEKRIRKSESEGQMETGAQPISGAHSPEEKIHVQNSTQHQQDSSTTYRT